MDNTVERKLAGTIYFMSGVLVILFSTLLICPGLLVCFFNTAIIPILWCIGWSLVGVGAGLINTRNHPKGGALHLIGYWGFVVLTVSIFSFVVSLYGSGENYPNLYVKFYSLSALLGLIGGFLGDIFRDLALKIIEKLELKDNKDKKSNLK